MFCPMKRLKLTFSQNPQNYLENLINLTKIVVRIFFLLFYLPHYQFVKNFFHFFLPKMTFVLK